MAVTIERRLALAQVEALTGKPGAADTRLSAIASQVLGPGVDASVRGQYLQLRGGVAGDVGRLEEADSLLPEAVEGQRERFGAGAP